MNAELMEELLNESEGTTLDFKREQYQFVGISDDDKKSELLKDILAFANAWRRTDGYILIGVEEVKGGRSKVVGITSHLDDASLQQFVNSKTQRPVVFSYEEFTFEGVPVGVIKVPIQDRPLYLVKNYGKLEKKIVYIRRGSATDTADPDEVAKMGISITPTSEAPRLLLEYHDDNNGAGIGSEITLTSTIVHYEESIIRRPHSLTYSLLSDNPDYKKEKAEYIKSTSFLNSVKFQLTNTGSILASKVQLVLPIKKEDGLRVIDNFDYPKKPSKSSIYFRSHVPTHFNSDYSVDELKDSWRLTVNFGNIRPKATVVPSRQFYIGSYRACELDLEGALFGDNIPDPIKVSLKVRISLSNRDLLDEELD